MSEREDFGPAMRGKHALLPRPSLPRRRRREPTAAPPVGPPVAPPPAGPTPGSAPWAAGQAQPRRAGRRGRRRGPLGALTRVLTFLLIAVLGLGATLVLVVSALLEREPVDGLASGGRPTNVLLVGSDSREGMTREEMNELSTGSIGGDLADTILLMSFQGSRTALLSFPRDLLTTRCDGSEGKLNAALSIGGMSCLVASVEAASGLPVHHTMEVRFLGFRDIVDAVGGVELCPDGPIRDAASGLDLPGGCQTLGGADALGYVRVRNIDSDLARMERQQEFVQALAGEIVQPRTLIDVPRLFRLAISGGNAVVASEATGPIALVRIGWALRGLAGGAPTYSVPGIPDTVGGEWVLRPDPNAAPALFAEFRSGAALGRSVAAAAPAPGDISVAVLNGAGVPGLAGTVADELAGRGYAITEVGDAERTARSVVRYPAGQRPAAELLASEVPVGVNLEESAVPVVTVVLGEDLAN